jgi:hypothetical protein
VGRGRANGGQRRLGGTSVLQRGPNGVDHVRSGVTVGHRVHVERVHFVDRALQTIGGGFENA